MWRRVPALAAVAGYHGRTSVSVALRRHKQLNQSQMITLITHEHRRLEREEVLVEEGRG